MITQAEAKELITRKRLSGHEAGRLWMEDSRLVERYQPGLLTEKELRSIGSKLRSQVDIVVYNGYLETYKRVNLALRDANITALTAESRLFYMSLIIKEYLDKDTTSRDRSWGYPEGTDLRTPMEGAIRTGLEHTGINIEELLAYERRIAEISEHTEVDFSSDIKRIKNRLREAIKVYNFYADAPEIPGEKISLDKFKPDKKTYKYLLQLVPTLPEKPEEGGY